MDEKVYLEKLEKREIKPTAIRLLILKAMTRFTRAFSLLDLETELDIVDKSTIFRTINLFLDHHLIHVIDDGSGSLKYSVCSNECTCSIDDLHAHFYCRNCHKTFCLRKIHVTLVTNMKPSVHRIVSTPVNSWVNPISRPSAKVSTSAITRLTISP